jgi:hypothetical protein
MDDALVQAGKDGLGQAGICFRRADVPPPVQADQKPGHKMLLFSQAGIHGQAAAGRAKGPARQTKKAVGLIPVQMMEYPHPQDQVESGKTMTQDIFHCQAVKLSPGSILFLGSSYIFRTQINSDVAHVCGQILQDWGMTAPQVQDGVSRGWADVVLDQAAVQPGSAQQILGYFVDLGLGEQGSPSGCILGHGSTIKTKSSARKG